MLADLQRGRMCSIQPVVRRGFTDVPTRSGASDTWHAAWIYEREVRQTTESDAAAASTRHVAEFLGLQSEQYDLQVMRLCFPIGRSPAGQHSNGRPLPVGPKSPAPIAVTNTSLQAAPT